MLIIILIIKLIQQLKSITPINKIGTMRQIPFQNYNNEGRQSFKKIFLQNLTKLNETI